MLQLGPPFYCHPLAWGTWPGPLLVLRGYLHVCFAVAGHVCCAVAGQCVYIQYLPEVAGRVDVQQVIGMGGGSCCA